MEKIGILYICTGNYNVFWKYFYESSEKFFLPELEKHYFVFTDRVENFQEYNQNVHVKYITSLPWPLITLMRFKYFLDIKEELEKMDYLMFSNSNLKFVVPITCEEFLPRKGQGEELFVTTHPGYKDKEIWEAPFERSKSSTAYVPYNKGTKYVIGALNGGTSAAFLKMAEQLNYNIEADLKKNIIARWHDESHLNKYIINFKNYRLLDASYCYPYGMQVSYEKKIETLGKEKYFDVNAYKGMQEKYSKYPAWIVKLGRKVKREIKRICYYRDRILN